VLVGHFASFVTCEVDITPHVNSCLYEGTKSENDSEHPKRSTSFQICIAMTDYFEVFTIL
jgi:hypothetical protein